MSMLQCECCVCMTVSAVYVCMTTLQMCPNNLSKHPLGHSVHNNTEHILWSQVEKQAIMAEKLIYYHIGTPTYMLNDVSKHPRPLKIMLNHIFKNQCHKPRNKKNTFLVSKVG